MEAQQTQQQLSAFGQQLSHVADSQQATALVIERINGRLDSHDAQFTAISKERDRLAEWNERRRESTPEGIRGWMVIAVAIAAISISVLCGGSELLVTLWQASH